MKAIVTLVFVLFVFNSITYAQDEENRKLKVIHIDSYDDGYLIKALDTLKHDTLNITSAKFPFKIGTKHRYQKISIGGVYNFLLFSRDSFAQPILEGNLIIKLRHTIIWKNGDDVRKVPFISKNMNGLYVKN